MKTRFAFQIVSLLAALLVSQIALSPRFTSKAFSDTTPTPAFSPLPLTTQGPYDPRPNHIWNRLYRQFYVRVTAEGKEFGYDSLDPLLWSSTKYLISGPSHQQAIRLLDEFLSSHAENLITDPLKRALFQRDLWAVFDWLSQSDSQQTEREELQARLAQVIQRLALTPEQIQLLPDNYNAAIQGRSFPAQYQPANSDASFLPWELLRTGGPWVELGVANNRLNLPLTQERPTAPAHLADMAFAGRSVFLVFMHLPEGHEATIAYLQRLKEFPQPWIPNPERSRPDQVLPNPDLPQFPAGTELALVRRMVLIDSLGHLTPTNITESIQLRVYRSVPSGARRNADEARISQKNFEFRLSRRKLFAGEAGGLRPVLSGEQEFNVFRSHGIDEFEGSMQSGGGSLDRAGVILDHCAVCHFAPGIHSVLSYSVQRFEPASLRPFVLIEARTTNDEYFTTSWKRRQYEWGLLTGLWQARH